MENVQHGKYFEFGAVVQEILFKDFLFLNLVAILFIGANNYSHCVSLQVVIW